MYCYKRVLALIFVQPQLSNEYVILWVHTYLGCISSKWLLSGLCIENGRHFDKVGYIRNDIWKQCVKLLWWGLLLPF
jgi:hypothetical protein